MVDKQLSLDLGRCQVLSKEGWRCTKWAGKHREHTAFAPSGWHPDYAIQMDGKPNLPPQKGISAYQSRILTEIANGR